MKSKIGILALFLLSQICFGQALTRKLIHGQVVNDSINVENVVVFNANSKTGTMTSKQGFFTINVKENDTLVFSSLQFKSKKYIYSEIKDSKLEAEKLKIQNQQISLTADEYKSKLEKANIKILQMEQDKVELERIIERLKHETMDVNARVQKLLEENGKINDLSIKRLKEFETLKSKSEEFERSQSSSSLSQIDEA